MEKLGKLENWFRAKENILVAFSGGVDSTLLLALSAQTLGTDKVLAVTVDSPLNKHQETENAKIVAEKLGVQHLVVKLNDLENPLVRANPYDRCYHCKKSRFEQLILIAKERGFQVIVEGSNLDDLEDFRPGLKAVEELNIASPLQEVGLTKEDIRKIAQDLGLTVWDKPSEPCLATRIPINTEITQEKLARICQAEEIIKEQLNLDVVRVRDHSDLARIEVKEKDLSKIIAKNEYISEKFKKLGFNFVTLDIIGYRTGSMNKLEV